MQKKVGNALYVFDTIPFTITEDADAQVIYVQNECLKGYLELNTELESKIKTFNQWLLCVNAPWADRVTTEPTKNYHLLTIPGYNEYANPIYVYGYDNNTLPGGASNLWFHNVNEEQRNAGMIDTGVTDKIYCNAGAEIFLMAETDIYESMSGFSLIDTTEFGQKYGVIMGDSDMTVDFSYTLKPKYHVNFSANSNVHNGYAEISDREQLVGKNVYIRLNGGDSPSTIRVTSADVDLTYVESSNWYIFTMPAHDVTINAYWVPIEISIDLGATDLTYSPDTPYDPSGTYNPHASFIVKAPEGKTTDNYTFVKSDDKISVNPVGEHFDMEFNVSGTVTFANA